MYSWRVSSQSDQSGRLGQDVAPGATEGGAGGRGKKGGGLGQRTLIFSPSSGVSPSLLGVLKKPRTLRDPPGLPEPPHPVTGNPQRIQTCLGSPSPSPPPGPSKRGIPGELPAAPRAPSGCRPLGRPATSCARSCCSRSTGQMCKFCGCAQAERSTVCFSWKSLVIC